MTTATSGSATAAAAGKRLAAVDMGSNSVRLLVTEVSPDGSYRVLDDEKQTTRLARGLADSGLLSDEAMRQTVEALGRMKAIAQGYGVERLEIIATSAVREAGNGPAFLKRIREDLGLPVEVISAAEEGQLSFASVARHFDLKGTNAVAVDLGGGSAEVILVANGVVEEIRSLPLGAVRLTDSFLPSDPCSPREYDRLKRHIRKCFTREIGRTEFVPHVMIGAGGTFTALANISMRRRGQSFSSVGGYELNRAEVRHILDHLKDLPLRARREVPGLNADRADIIVAGLTVVERLMKFLHVNRLRVHDQGVRDGLMLRMVGKVVRRKGAPPATADDDASDPLGGVRQFAAACAVEQRHAEHVRRLALQLFEQLQGPLHLGPADAVILEAAALLHEVGNLINYERHHHHSYHLIMHGNLRGLSPHQRELVANVARYHRRSGPKLKHDNYARLSAADRQTVLHLSAILRVADGLDRTHMQRVEQVECRCRGDQMTIKVRSAQSPDVDLWGAMQKGKLFEKVFGRKLKFAWQSPDGTNGRGNRGRGRSAAG